MQLDYSNSARGLGDMACHEQETVFGHMTIVKQDDCILLLDTS